MRLAIVATHPIQYNAPWFRFVAETPGLALRVFYLWDFGVHPRNDPGFGHAIEWDVPLLSEYEHQFVPNCSPWPGTHHRFGLWNPALTRELRDWRPDAVLVFGYNFATLLHLILRWPRNGAPLLFRGDSHRLVKRQDLGDAIKHILISAVLRRFAAFLCVGAANREYLDHHGVPSTKIFDAPHAIDNDRFTSAASTAQLEAVAWRASLGVPAHHAVVLFAGKFEVKKRPLDLLAAFVSAGLADASLLFVGAGPLELELRAAAAGRPDVFFAPFQNQSQMPRVYAAADLFVLPSYGPAETWGLSVNEAMCMGRAVIASDHVGCARDLVIPWTTGLVFPAGDVAALSRCLREALADRVRLRSWGVRGSETVARFSYRETTAGLLRALASLGASPA